MAAEKTHVLRVSLKPKLYRDIEIDSARSLSDLAEAICTSFDFEFDHAFGFYSIMTSAYRQSPEQYELAADSGEGSAKSVAQTRVDQAFPKVGKKLQFVFDYEAGWSFQVELTALGEKAPQRRYPRMVAAMGDAPDQYPDDDF
ncbi:IS1096 element passenger TnpR family protein [Reyranella sp.]|uniref:IS1096 element passenger TnpR family protein n=1 Tax=Reyranella sp. TaxID=1929291 RepID=UPI003BAA4488